APRCHVDMRLNITAATTSGSQPPCSSLVEAAAKNAESIVSSSTLSTTTTHGGQPHRFQAHSEASIVVISMSSDTAMPYAPASALEDRKPTTRITVETNSSALTTGT